MQGIRWHLVETSAPGSEPVSTAEAKAQCNVESSFTADDALLDRLIEAARQKVEGDTGLVLMPQTYKLVMDRFPGFLGIIRLPKPPLSQVDSIKYVDTDGVEQTLDASKYVVGNPSGPRPQHAIIRPAYDNEWPTTRQQPEAVTITFTCGYADADSVPEGLKQAILLLVAHWYRHREAVETGTIATTLPLAVTALVGTYSVAERQDW